MVKTFSFSFLSVIDDPLICRYNNADYYYHTNHQGSVTELLGQSGGIVKTYRYDAFGNILQETGPTWNRGFTYTGRERHYRSGLYYYRFRFYDPQTGRFITEDPILWGGGINLYAYCSNDPLNWIDPFGLSWIIYDRSDNNIYIYPGTKETLGPPQAFPAYNRAKNPAGDPLTPKSYGPAPNGTFPMGNFVRTDAGPNSAYGYGFIPIILPPGPNGQRTGVGLHAGRANVGPKYGTRGCIRTTEDAMKNLEGDAPTEITIQE